MMKLKRLHDKVEKLKSLGSVHIERVTLRLRLRVTRRRKFPHSIGYQTHFINVHSIGGSRGRIRRAPPKGPDSFVSTYKFYET